MKDPVVKLISWTSDPVHLLWEVWEGSRNHVKREWHERFRPEAEHLLGTMLMNHLPLLEMVDFVFEIDNVSIALREQMVRHRVGMKFHNEHCSSAVPEIGDSTWWSQSMRVLEMGEFASQGAYHVPDSVKDMGAGCLRNYQKAMEVAGLAYKALIDSGIPAEDARNVIPLAATHRIAWKINLAALIHVVGKRGCWILQLGLWEPVIRGMVEEISTKVSSLFKDLIRPPCIPDPNGVYKKCVFDLDNRERYVGVQHQDPCPLWLHNESEQIPIPIKIRGREVYPVWKREEREAYTPHWFKTEDQAATDLHEDRRERYSELWNRCPLTGRRSL